MSKSKFCALGMDMYRKQWQHKANHTLWWRQLQGCWFMLHTYIVMFIWHSYTCPNSPMFQLEARFKSIKVKSWVRQLNMWHNVKKHWASSAPHCHSFHLYLHALLNILFANTNDHCMFEKPNIDSSVPCTFASWCIIQNNFIAILQNSIASVSTNPTTLLRSATPWRLPIPNPPPELPPPALHRRP